MALAPGTRLGPYEILAPLGAGGMGEVYRARDTKLKRDVALKVLPDAFASDPDRMARFQREAEVLASLNHPNIAHIYGVEDRALVMELVEGAEPRGPLDFDEAWNIASQIAAALEYAHDKGIVHRDLKPANIKITPEGVVKLLDFGLAKAFTNQRETTTNAENSPTLTIGATETGVILGTACYMSPEQARGKTVDRRTDIWAFGCVLYELLTGQRAFSGEAVSDTLAAILKSEPDWTPVPATARRLLRACLEKDPKKRLQAIGDRGLLLGNDGSEATAPKSPTPFWIAAVAILAVVAVIGWLRPRPQPPPARRISFSTTVSASGRSGLTSMPLILPDGSAIVYGANGKGYMRGLDSVDPQEFRTPAPLLSWSPDSRFLAFHSSTQILKLKLPDGAPELMGEVPSIARGAGWSDTGWMVIAAIRPAGLYTLSASGGETTRVEVPGLKAGGYYYPEFLPGGRDFLFAFVPDGSEETGIYLARFTDGKVTNPILLFNNETAVRYTPAGGGLILYVRDDNLYSQHLNLRTRKVEGAPDLVAQKVSSSPSSRLANFSVSRAGDLAWRSGTADLSQIVIFDRTGKQTGTAGPPGALQHIQLSPDEKRLLGASETGAWLFEPGQIGTFSLGSQSEWRAWSPDGSRLLGMDSDRIVYRTINGSAESRELVRAANLSVVNMDISSDGKWLLLCGASSIRAVKLDGSPQEPAPTPVVQTEGITRYARFSPDARWVVYLTTNHRGQGIYVQRFPEPSLPKQIASTIDGYSPIWSQNGKEILYYNQNRIWSVRVDTVGSEIRATPPEALFPVRAPRTVIANSVLAVSHDGSRIYYVQPVEQPGSDVINVRTALLR